jgi:hypothetical protein
VAVAESAGRYKGVGYELGYDARPNLTTYRPFLGLTDFIRRGIVALGPRENIDIQSFMCAVGKEGHVRDALDRREGQGVSQG